MKLSLGFSPCPNDTFIFDALVNNKIDTGDLSFDVELDDVETLNQKALAGKLDITKLSYGVLPLVLEKYILLNSGSALGSGVGPLLIQNSKLKIENIEEHLIAIPGEHTTAHLLFSLAWPAAKNKTFLRYNQIEDFVLAGNGLGVIIHENRFTYEARGLSKITDLGNFWEKETGKPIPLGGIVVKRSLDNNIKIKVGELIKKSIEYAYLHNYQDLTGYVKQHAQEMSEAVMRKHIDLYVNNYSLSLGKNGRKAVLKLLDVYSNIHPDNKIQADDVFVES
jgi:1,4-dihydroxy-6-naphthoate synthase